MTLQRRWLKDDNYIAWSVVNACDVEELEQENTTLRQRVAYLESCICETCHDPECKDSATEYYVQEIKRLKKENEELQARIDAYLKAQEPKECAAPVCGTLCKACEENI